MGKTQKSPVSPKHQRPKVLVENRQKDLKLKKILVQQAVIEILSFLKVFPDEVAIYFVSEAEISDLHGRFFKDPTPTDCISFPLDHSFLGEIFICPFVALTYATSRKIDPYQEVLLYLVHGILHLIGYDDLIPQEKRKMRSMEKRCLKMLAMKQKKLYS